MAISDRDDGLLIRRDAAIKLVIAGAITGWDALALVVFPPAALVDVTRRRRTYPEATRLEARRLHATGLSAPEVARRMGLPYTTVKPWIWPPSKAQKARRGELQRTRRQQIAA